MKTKILLIVALVSYGLWQFWPLLHAGFVYEDRLWVPYYTVNWPVYYPTSALTQPWQNYFLNRAVIETWLQPILPGRFWTVVSLWLNYRLGGVDPIGYHLGNLLIHAANIGLIFALGRKLWPESFGLPLMASAIFGLHGLQYEAVSYVTARAELLATLFVLGSVYALLGRRWMLAILLALMAGASKESAVVVWIILAGIVAAHSLTRWGWAVLICGISASAVFGIGFISSRSLWHMAAPVDAWRYAGVQIAASVRYLGLFLWPHGLTVDHDFDGIGIAAIVAACAFLAALFSWAWRKRQQAPEVLIGLLWMGIVIGPRLILRTPEYLNEHQLYLPMVGMTFVCCGLIRAWLDAAPVEDLACLFGL